MNFAELAKARYSLRKYDISKDVEQEKLEAVLESARIAPTAVNYQPQRVFVLKDQEKIAGLKEAGSYFFPAPVYLFVGYEESAAWVRSYDGKNHGEQDAAIAATHMMLQAADLGLGTCWLGAFDIQVLSKLLGIPEGIKLICAMPLGYPAENAHPARLHNEKFPTEHMVQYL